MRCLPIGESSDSPGMTVPTVPERCGVEIPAGLEVLALAQSPEAPLDGLMLAMCRDCTELNEQLDVGLES